MFRYVWISFFFIYQGLFGFEIIWPTPNKGFLEGKPLATFIQPTVSGKVESGLFGLVRNHGKQFHEGIDIKPLKYDRKGESIDPVYAVMAGKVVYVNKIAGNSSYGRYVVLEHNDVTPAVYTMYAHMKSISSGIYAGALVRMGQQLGVLGRSSLHGIAKAQAHLHFEVGLRLSGQFSRYYDKKKYKERNYHGNYNGMNLEGFDPLAFFKAVKIGKVNQLSDYIQSMDTAFKLRVNFGGYPDFTRRYPSLVAAKIPSKEVKAWEVEFTWNGLPKRWTPLRERNSKQRIELVYVDESSLPKSKKRNILKEDKVGIGPGSALDRILFLLFG